MWKTIKIDVVQEIYEMVLNNPEFNSDKWSLHQAEILIKAGELIKSEINKKSHITKQCS